jgi:hypothetical protein
MDEERNVLEKKINLHVKDIERIQGLMARLSKKKGQTVDELRRVKDQSKKTMQLLTQQKKIHQG